MSVARLNWACGDWVEPGWINCDVKDVPGADFSCDIRSGLPLDDDSLAYAVSIHTLPELPLEDQVPALRELRRVLRPGGVLRLGLPDLLRSVDAYCRGDRSYFAIPDEEMQTLGGKLIVQLVWYGYSRTPFVAEFAEELLRKAGFREVTHVGFGRTASGHSEIVHLDNRERESLFIEAVK